MTTDSNSFDDPRLKSAVKRVWSGETAPAELRRRVEAMLVNGPAATPAVEPAPEVIKVAPSFWRTNRIFGIAAAAAVVLTAGVVVSQMRWSGSSPVAANAPSAVPVGLLETPATPSAVPASPLTVPAELNIKLTAKHDFCCKHAGQDHHHFTDAPKDDFKAIAQGMTTQLHYPVVATSISDDWDFRGAAICKVGAVKSAHLIYAHGDAFVSVFSLPAKTVGAPDEPQVYDSTVDGHPVAGFVEEGTFVCVVGSTSGKDALDLEQIKAVRDHLRDNEVAMSVEPRITLATALR